MKTFSVIGRQIEEYGCLEIGGENVLTTADNGELAVTGYGAYEIRDEVFKVPDCALVQDLASREVGSFAVACLTCRNFIPRPLIAR